MFLIKETIQGFKVIDILRIEISLVMILTAKVFFECQTMQHSVDSISSGYAVKSDRISVRFGNEIELTDKAADLPIVHDESEFLSPTDTKSTQPTTLDFLLHSNASKAHEDICLSFCRCEQGNGKEHISQLFLVELLPCSREPEVKYPIRKSMWNLPAHSDNSQSV